MRPELINDAVQFMMALYRAFEDTDASLAEINPFLVTGDNKVYALDAKMTFDDNALYRHKDIKELRDLNEEDPLEIEASKFGLNYIKLDGNCRVHGQRRRSGNGDDGHHQACRRQPGKFPRRRRRRIGPAGRKRVSNSSFRPEREGRAD